MSCIDRGWARKRISGDRFWKVVQLLATTRLLPDFKRTQDPHIAFLDPSSRVGQG